jgi:hypothetical protein
MNVHSLTRLFLLLLVSVLTPTADTALADHPDFRFKWPFLPGENVTVTGYPFTDHHGCPAQQGVRSCTDAFDFDIGASDQVRSAAEGSVQVAIGNLVGCDLQMNGATGYGNFVEVSVPSSSNVRYAHLQTGSVGVSVDAIVLQGDFIGNEGGTGTVRPCPGGDHLHIEWPQGHPNEVDGQTTVPLQGPNSTNSVIGEFSAMGATLRTYFISQGGWNAIGWTHKHCPGTCTLNMTANRSWGRMQDFRHHPDGFGGEFNTIHVAGWDQTHAYLVDSVFWQAWAGGGSPAGSSTGPWPIGMARQDRAGSCPAGSTPACISFQKFHVGYVWMDSFTGRTAVYCVDVDNDGSSGFGDYVIMLAAWNSHGPPNPAPVWDARADFDGDNTVGFGDLNSILATWNDVCRPA